jgi:membrane dipeptidase
LDSLNVVIDISHSGEQSFWDLMELTTHPVIASHSSCRELRDHHRNLTDEQLKAVAATGGVVMINFFPGFIVSGMPNDAKARLNNYIDKLNEYERVLGADTKAYLAARDSLINDARSQNLPTILDVADHIMHAYKIAGTDHVGLGSDFDGIGYAPFGLHDVTQLPYLTRTLLKRGLSPIEVKNIMGGNFVRIFSQITR